MISQIVVGIFAVAILVYGVVDACKEGRPKGLGSNRLAKKDG